VERQCVSDRTGAYEKIHQLGCMRGPVGARRVHDGKNDDDYNYNGVEDNAEAADRHHAVDRSNEYNHERSGTEVKKVE
jgi:hypothetical protein